MSTVRHLDPVCHAFDAAWKAGLRPKIEEFLPDTAPSVRSQLFRKLLQIDLAYRVSHNDKPTLEEYRSRFPEEGDVIRDVFRDASTAGDVPHSGPLPTLFFAAHSAGEPGADLPAVPGYEILDQLAPGGMGVVYRTRQTVLNRTVALKMIRTGVHAGPQERARFHVEAEAVASLSHPQIIQIYDYGEWNGMPYLAMEFAEGGSLAQRLAAGPLPLVQAAAMVETLARAVDFVHERGLIHRDLKPANVLLTAEGVPKLADFGLAKRLGQDQGLTQTHAVLGTASYMAPEQASGDKHALGPAVDGYALGAILYELLTGQPPFRGETRELTIHQLLSEEPLPPRQLRPEVPPELEAICLKCLEKEPGRRYASALALAEDLRRYQNGEPISISSFGTLDWHNRLARRAGYEILDILEAGVPGIVYKARHLPLNRSVALQMIGIRERLDAVRLAQLRTEAEALAKLRHPNIVEVYDFGDFDGEPYLVREYVEGHRLADGFAGPLQPADQIASLVEALARAVHYAHLEGVVHGSLKPSKVFVGTDGTSRIIGFGMTKLSGEYAAVSSYMAPEQVENRAERIGPATDVYALGAMLYELLTGRPPVLADTVRDTLEQVRHGQPEPPRHWRPEVPRELEAICLKCLEKEPAQRYPNAAALAEDLRRFRSGEVLYIDDLDDWAHQKQWARRAGYEILDVLDQGRDSFSYKARQVALDRIVFLKRIAARDRFVPAAKARFRRDAHLLARLRHPNFVQLYDQGEQNDLSYFAREFVDGLSLGEQVQEAVPVAFSSSLSHAEREEGRVKKAAELVGILARAIQAAHALGIVHGGLTPDHVRLTPAGVPKITSFQRVRLHRSDDSQTVPESTIACLAAYLAPEQLDGSHRSLNPAVDIYALGAILYMLLTGRPPFPGPTRQETLDQVRSQEPVPPRRWQPAIPPELEGICLKCLEKQPGRRPASAPVLAEELRRFFGR